MNEFGVLTERHLGLPYESTSSLPPLALRRTAAEGEPSRRTARTHGAQTARESSGCRLRRAHSPTSTAAFLSSFLLSLFFFFGEATSDLLRGADFRRGVFNAVFIAFSFFFHL